MSASAANLTQPHMAHCEISGGSPSRFCYGPEIAPLCGTKRTAP